MSGGRQVEGRRRIRLETTRGHGRVSCRTARRHDGSKLRGCDMLCSRYIRGETQACCALRARLVSKRFDARPLYTESSSNPQRSIPAAFWPYRSFVMSLIRFHCRAAMLCSVRWPKFSNFAVRFVRPLLVSACGGPRGEYDDTMQAGKTGIVTDCTYHDGERRWRETLAVGTESNGGQIKFATERVDSTENRRGDFAP